MGKPTQDREDVRIIAEALIRFGQMSLEERRQHAEQHPEDLLQSIPLPDRGGHRSIGRDGARAFSRMTKRQCEVDPDGDAIDVEKLDLAIRKAFVEYFIAQRRPFDEQKWIDRMLNRAMKEVKATHEERTHYLPCVILRKGHPDEFRIGPVRFVTKDKFFATYWQKIKADHEDNRRNQRVRLDQLILDGKYRAEDKKSDEESRRLNQMTLDEISTYYNVFTWIAEVTVPDCSSRVSRERAETTAQAALDVLKLYFGFRGGKDFRLGHHRGKRDRTAHLTHGNDGVFHYSISSGGEGGSAPDGWYESIKDGPSWWSLDAAGSAIEAYLKPGIVHSDHRDRWLGALHWYGQAVSETVPASQLVKYVAALERLTVLEETKTVDDQGTQKLTEVVTRRVALLGSESDDPIELARAREQARTLYKWRSALMHGRSSPLTKELRDVMHLAHSLAQRAMFAALEIYIKLDMDGKISSRDLEVRFCELEAFLPDTSVALP